MPSTSAGATAPIKLQNTLKETNMAFEFIREEITEARYIPSASDTVGRDMTDVGESLEQLLMLQQMRYENPKFVKKVCVLIPRQIYELSV